MIPKLKNRKKYSNPDKKEEVLEKCPCLNAKRAHKNVSANIDKVLENLEKKKAVSLVEKFSTEQSVA